MADRMEREIEEILSKLDVDAPKERAPISIMSKRRKARPASTVSHRIDAATRLINPALLLLLGAAIMVAGLILSNFWSPLIWAAFGGVVIFLAAFVLSFRRGPRPAGSNAPQGHYWRDRYIEYRPTHSGFLDSVKRRLRR